MNRIEKLNEKQEHAVEALVANGYRGTVLSAPGTGNVLIFIK